MGIGFYELVERYNSSYTKNINIKWIDTSYCKDNLMKKMDSIFNDYLSFYSFNVIMHEFNEYSCKKGIKPDSNDNLISFYKQLEDEDYIKEINTLFPELLTTMNLRINFFIDYINKIFKDLELFKNDYEFNELEFIEFNLGDSHDDGKTVCELIVDQKELIYKPRSCDLDIRFNKFVATYIKNYEVEAYNYTDFSIHNKLKYEQPKSLSEIKKYYYNIGFISSIMYFLNSTDMHYENLIVSGEKPIFIDLETLTDVVYHEVYSPATAFFKMLSDTVLRTMVYPLKLNYIDMEISALTGQGQELESFHYKVPNIVDEDKDSVRFEDKNPMIIEQKNRISFQGKNQNPIDYISSIKNGFNDFAINVINNKDDIFKDLCEVIGNSDIRQILRPTHLYAKYIDTSFEAYYLQNKQYRQELFDILSNKISSLNKEKLSNQIKFEKDCLINADVPIFHAKPNKRNLYSKDILISYDFFDQSPLDKIKEKITQFTLKDLDRELNIIESSLLVDSYSSNNEISIDKTIMNTKGIDINDTVLDLKKEALKINNKFLNTLKLIDNKVTGIIPSFSGEGFLLSGVNSSIYETGGCILMLVYNKDELNISDDFIIKIISTIKDLSLDYKSELSSFYGIGSYIYLNYLIYKKTNNVFFYDEVKEYMEILVTEKFDIKSIDFINGVSGIVTLISNIYAEIKVTINEDFRVRIYNFIRTNSYYIINSIDNNEEIENIGAGLAHGFSGLILGLASVNRILKDKGITGYISYLMTKEEKLYDENRNNYYDLRNNSLDAYYFCYGLPGIIQTRIYLYNLGYTNIENDLKIKLDRFVEDIINNKLNINNMSHCLCHGIGSIIDVLEDAFRSNLISKSNYEDTFNKLIGECCNNNINGIHSTSELLTFMLGEAGKVYNITRYLDKTIPSLLILNTI